MILQRRIVFASVSLGLGFAIGLGVLFVRAAWSEPGNTPPDGNIAAPLNVSDVTQSKAGQLILGDADPTVAFIISKDYYAALPALGMDAILGGPVGIGSQDISVYKNKIVQGGGIQGGLDIAWNGSPATLLLGASGNNNTRSLNTVKGFSIASPNFGNSGFITAISGRNTDDSNELLIGGGANDQRGVTDIGFFTAPNNFADGEQRMTISRNGEVAIGPVENPPKIPAPNGGGENLDVNDVYLRSVGQWVSQGLGFSHFLTFDTPGTYQWTVPAGVKKVLVEAWGAGAVFPVASSCVDCFIAGGGSGAYGKGIYPVIAGGSYSVEVGEGGDSCARLPQNIDERNGGKSSFGGLITSYGGSFAPNIIATSDGQFSISGSVGGYTSFQMGNSSYDRIAYGSGGDAPLGGTGGKLISGPNNSVSVGGQDPGAGAHPGSAYACSLARGGNGRVVVWW